ncbi:hypothetical protein UFOVP611_45 [uncultured Caudovirales phage]|uniref:Holin n=1 Tax=uncultured Caudovirales phage TaxID=2100421 RepID=A0A6J5N3V7_9CAUD|nr:hypothetical protein UFOVP611_45 [uncultured Caudovirales phage]
MKNFEQLGDLLALGVGILGAFLKGVKNKLKLPSILLGCLVAGVLTFSIIGVIEFYYSTLPPKFVVLISFTVGWVANEITEKMDAFVNDVYDILIEWIKGKFKSKKNENDH